MRVNLAERLPKLRAKPFHHLSLGHRPRSRDTTVTQAVGLTQLTAYDQVDH